MPTKPTVDFAILEAWRAQGADRINPLAFHFMEALRKRMATHDGTTRLLLEKTLLERIDAYASDLERAASKAKDRIHPKPSTALAALANELAGRTSAGHTRAATTDSAFPEMSVLDDVRKLWSNVRTSNQVRRSLEKSPENAGPLNSTSLVHRSLTLMREVSPGYLQQFMSYIDALSWLEQLSDHGALAATRPPLPASGRARAPRSARKRRDPA